MTSEHKETVEVLKVLFDQWKEEHELLDEFVRDLSDWATQDSHERAPQFGEAASRLRRLKDRLREHFEKEQAIGVLLAESRGIPTPEVEAVNRQADKDHELLIDRLQNLIESMVAANPDLDAWKAAIYEFNLFLDVLEQHEEIEAENVRWLLPATPQN